MGKEGFKKSLEVTKDGAEVLGEEFMTSEEFSLQFNELPRCRAYGVSALD